MPEPHLEKNTDLRNNEAVELAAALSASIATRWGLRCLFIKGPGAVAAGMRPARSSADVDVLTHPDDVDSFVAHPIAHGWKLRPFPEGMGIPKHSHTVYHPHWPCDIDIHFRFPGLDASPTEAFATLQRNSENHFFGNVMAKVPSRAGMLIIQVTHALRNLDADGHFSESAKEDYGFALNINNPVAWSDLVPMLDGTRSWAAMEPYLSNVYSENIKNKKFPAPSVDWNMRTVNKFSGKYRIAAIIRAPWKQKFQILHRSLIPSREDLAAGHLPLLEASTWTLARFRLQRLARFIRSFPKLVLKILGI